MRLYKHFKFLLYIQFSSSFIDLIFKNCTCHKLYVKEIYWPVDYKSNPLSNLYLTVSIEN